MCELYMLSVFYDFQYGILDNLMSTQPMYLTHILHYHPCLVELMHGMLLCNLMYMSHGIIGHPYYHERFGEHLLGINMSIAQ